MDLTTPPATAATTADVPGGVGAEESTVVGMVMRQPVSEMGSAGTLTVTDQEEMRKMEVMVALDESDGSFYALRWALDHLFRGRTLEGNDRLGRVTVVHVQEPFQHYVFPAGPGGAGAVMSIINISTRTVSNSVLTTKLAPTRLSIKLFRSNRRRGLMALCRAIFLAFIVPFRQLPGGYMFICNSCSFLRFICGGGVCEESPGREFGAHPLSGTTDVQRKYGIYNTNIHTHTDMLECFFFFWEGNCSEDWRVFAYRNKVDFLSINAWGWVQRTMCDWKNGALCRQVKAETLIMTGDPKDMICQATEQMHVDLLVVGSRGLGKIKR